MSMGGMRRYGKRGVGGTAIQRDSFVLRSVGVLGILMAVG